MPSVNRVATSSPYADPNTPIASAKRPRTAHRKAAVAALAAKGGVGVLQAIEQDAEGEASHEHDDTGAPQSHTLHEGEEEGEETHCCQHPHEEGEGVEGEGSWKGRVMSLFSPMLKVVNPHSRPASLDGHQHDGDEEEEEDHDGENDGNAENQRAARKSSTSSSPSKPHHDSHHLAPHSPGPLPSDAQSMMPQSPPPKAPRRLVRDSEEDEEEKYVHDVLADDEAHAKAHAQPEMCAVQPEDETACMEVATTDDTEDDEVVEEFNPFLFIKHLPPYQHVAIPGKLCLPSRKITRSSHSPVTLVLDLDETLVHCTVEPVADPDVIFPVDFNGVQYQVHVRKRPYLDEFLSRVSKMFEVVVFTASQQVYADALLDLIDPHNKLVKYRLFRDACLPVEGNYIKDLNVLGRDMAKTVLVDNSPYAYGYQIDNGIPIESWFEDRNDRELLKLIPFLEELLVVEDVRPLIRNTFQTFIKVHSA